MNDRYGEDAPRALSAKVENGNLILDVVEKDFGGTLTIPISEIKYLKDAPPDLVSEVLVIDDGDGLEWATLDIHYHVWTLVELAQDLYDIAIIEERKENPQYISAEVLWRLALEEAK